MQMQNYLHARFALAVAMFLGFLLSWSAGSGQTGFAP
jgi:hypothetical protein